MTETLCDSGAVKIKAGANAPTFTAAQYTDAINKAEGFVCTQARYDYVTNYASVSAIGKTFLKDVTSSKAAIEVMNNDMSGFTSRTESQVMLDVNYTNVVDCVNLLRDDKFRDFVIKGVVS
jgi:hypothetical protein